jgi:hypothetical protein
MKMLRDELEELIERERAVVESRSRKRRWTKIEWAITVIGAGAGFAALLAAAPPLAPVALGAPIFQFGGWVAGKRGQVEPQAVLTGASLFLSAQHTPGWVNQPAR